MLDYLVNTGRKITVNGDYTRFRCSTLGPLALVGCTMYIWENDKADKVKPKPHRTGAIPFFTHYEKTILLSHCTSPIGCVYVLLFSSYTDAGV